MDVQAVRAAGARAIDRARAGEGPSILEMRTERYRGHSMADPAKYRRKDEAHAIHAPDPIERLREKILRGGGAGEAILKRIDSEIRSLVGEAADYAAHSPEPDEADLEKDVLL
jgi:pyruvate dehydrogenase E1 component alpha subunit